MSAQYESDGGVVFCVANANSAIVLPLPATRPVGSVLLLIAFCRLITATAPTVTGYTLLHTFTAANASGGRMWALAKEVVGGETDPSITPVGTTGTSGDLFGAGIFCYSGVDLSGGISAIVDSGVQAPQQTDAFGTTPLTFPAMSTPVGGNPMVVRFLSRFRDAADTFTPTATWNEREDIGSTIRTGGQFFLQDKLTTGGTQLSVTVAPSVTTSSLYLAVTYPLKSAVAATSFMLPNRNLAITRR